MGEEGFVGFVGWFLGLGVDDGLEVDLVDCGDLFVRYAGDGFDVAGGKRHGCGLGKLET